MTFEYDWNRNDLKKVIKKKRKISTIIFLSLGTILYFYLTYFGFLSNYFDNIKLILGFFIYLAVIYLIIFLANMIYTNIQLKRNDKRTNNAYGKYIIKVDDEKILSIFNDQKISYKWQDISKLKIRKNYFFIRTKNDYIGLTFRKSTLTDNYDKLLNFIKDKTSN